MPLSVLLGVPCLVLWTVLRLRQRGVGKPVAAVRPSRLPPVVSQLAARGKPVVRPLAARGKPVVRPLAGTLRGALAEFGALQEVMPCRAHCRQAVLMAWVPGRWPPPLCTAAGIARASVWSLGVSLPPAFLACSRLRGLPQWRGLPFSPARCARLPRFSAPLGQAPHPLRARRLSAVIQPPSAQPLRARASSAAQ